MTDKRADSDLHTRGAGWCGHARKQRRRYRRWPGPFLLTS
jgi:hypothetical protein